MPSLLSLIPKDATHVLDFGSGPGQFMAKLGATYKVEGVDSSSAMISIAKKAYPHISFKQWNGQSPYPGNQKFDVIFSKLTIHFVEDLSKFAGFSYQILHEEGCLVLSVPHPFRTISEVDGKYSRVGTYNGAIGKYGLYVQMIHRSLEEYTQPFVQKGFTLTGLLEPRISRDQGEEHDVPKEDFYLPKRLNLRFRKV